MNVKIARIKKGLTQKQLCEIVKTSPRKLVAIERGNVEMVTLGLANRIAKALDSTIEELFLSDEE